MYHDPSAQALTHRSKHARRRLSTKAYEEEADLFSEDLSDKVLDDDVFSRLVTFPNVLITGHQAFFTEEALRNIAGTTIANIDTFERGEGTLHRVTAAA